MRGSLQGHQVAAAEAYLAWWALAGVDCAVAEEPGHWLRPADAARAPDRLPPPSDMATPVAREKPATLDLFHLWLTGDAQPERRWPGPVILPQGGAGAPLMVVVDMPDPTDMTAGALLADRAGLLFDAMLRALGLMRGDVHVASLFLSRPPGGMVETSDLRFAVDRMRTHVALARPRRLLLLGDRTARALLPADSDENPDGLRSFNYDGGIVPAVATFHPRLLLTQPAAKAQCWQMLQCLIEENRL
ncbi:MAG: uracil-DNA glycosylase family protein [Sphingobium sp.]